MYKRQVGRKDLIIRIKEEERRKIEKEGKNDYRYRRKQDRLIITGTRTFIIEDDETNPDSRLCLRSIRTCLQC